MQLYIDGTDELFKICEREPLNRNYIGFSVNIAGECIKIHGLVREKSVKYYFSILRAKIPFHKESAEEVEEFIHALLTLRVRFFYSYQLYFMGQRKYFSKFIKTS